MRTVVLREYSGSVHTIPYSAIDTVTNFTKDFSYAVFDIGVAYRENVDQVMEVLREIGAEMNRDPALPPADPRAARGRRRRPVRRLGGDHQGAPQDPAAQAVGRRAASSIAASRTASTSSASRSRSRTRRSISASTSEGQAPPVKVVLEGAPAAPRGADRRPSEQTAEPAAGARAVARWLSAARPTRPRRSPRAGAARRRLLGGRRTTPRSARERGRAERRGGRSRRSRTRSRSTGSRTPSCSTLLESVSETRPSGRPPAAQPDPPAPPRRGRSAAPAAGAALARLLRRRGRRSRSTRRASRCR